MNSKHAFLALSVFTLVSIAHGEREVFAPTKLAPVATAANGNITFSNTNPFWTGANISSTTNFGIGPTTANLLSFHSNGAERMRISSTGNVFVGNGETVASVANGNIRATGGSGTNINGADLVLHGGQSTGTASGGALRFFTAPAGGVSGTSVNASTERMRIQSDGIVNIGGGLSLANATSFAGKQVVIAGGDADGGALSFYANASFVGNTGRIAAIPTAFGSNSSSALTFSTNSGSQLNERMHITAAGDVGIGVGPNNRLNLTYNGASGVATVGPNSTSGNTALTLGTSSSGTYAERMRIDSAGDVYIGNGVTAASPTAGTIRGTSGSGTNIAGAGLVVVPGQGTGSGAGGPFRVLTAPAGTSGSSLNAAVERVRVKQGGQVRFVPLAAAPTLDVEDGDVYYNSTTNKLQVRAAGVWVDLH